MQEEEGRGWCSGEDMDHRVVRTGWAMCLLPLCVGGEEGGQSLVFPTSKVGTSCWRSPGEHELGLGLKSKSDGSAMPLGSVFIVP